MRFYQASAFLFPGSFRLRIFTICFVATHVPLLSLLGWQLWTGQAQLATTMVVLFATLGGTAFALAAIHGLLVPLDAASAALEKLERGDSIRELPERGRDVVARLLGSVNRAARATQGLIRTLDERAHLDPLTGLRNRRGFSREITLLSLRRPAALAILDLDHFKQVNDTLGHDAGDHVLAAFGAALSASLRRSDLAGRWGGEEFIVYFADTDGGEAMLILERFARHIAEHPVGHLNGRPISFSAGVAEIEDSDWAETVRKADAALYGAKRTGRNRAELTRD